ncbi:hypothetical protein [Nonomuraea endophytica]|uniref:Proline-rich protein n=1 Tax=Nonomuraea endophytica TaxID=714136 RepID=A0A7W8EHC1_9ACTN|nr:hypothetical protein [Nonomuraea endophytica]MBB5080785.1 hypothetical protein [Nonomuraea endophytica]
MTPAQYAHAVREALADHPDRDELLEDLDDHLAEIAEESEVPLEERLGPPAAYAEELVAAYGGRPQSPRERRGFVAPAREWLGRQPAYQEVAAFMPQLRPGWWVLRGYAAAMGAVSVIGPVRLVPGSPVDVLLVVGAILGSIWYGRRASGRLLRGFTIAANALVAIVIFGGLATASNWSTRDEHVAYTMNGSVEMEPAAFGDTVYNIKPYAKDGTPLSDVLLYDQDGQPITTSPDRFGYRVDRSCGEPVLNRFPLPLIEEDPYEDGGRAAAPPTASTCAAFRTPEPSATASGAPLPSVKASEPATGAPSPSQAPTSTPSPSKSR